MYKHVVKRLIDIILSSVAIVVLALPMLIIAIAIKIDDPGPVLFKQKRVGKKKDGQITYFMIWKFRSMKMSTPHDTPTHLLQNPEQYITRVGRFIRKTSLDELPQIYQVFTSQLSVIGPRPALWSQDDLIAEREKYGANDIKPGITGWAQINGRNSIDSWEQRFEYDLEYVDNMSLEKELLYIFTCGRNEWQYKNVVIEGTLYDVYSIKDWNKNKTAYIEKCKREMQGKYLEQQKEGILMDISSVGEELVVSLKTETNKMVTDVSIGVFNSDGYLVEGFENPIQYKGTSVKIPKLEKGTYCVGLYENNTDYQDPAEYEITIDTRQVLKDVNTIDAVVSKEEEKTETTKLIAIVMMCCSSLMFIVMIVLRVKRRKAEENV